MRPGVSQGLRSQMKTRQASEKPVSGVRVADERTIAARKKNKGKTDSEIKAWGENEMGPTHCFTAVEMPECLTATESASSYQIINSACFSAYVVCFSPQGHLFETVAY